MEPPNRPLMELMTDEDVCPHSRSFKPRLPISAEVMQGTSCWISEEGPAVLAAFKLPATASADITSWRVQSRPAISTMPERVPSPSRPGMSIGPTPWYELHVGPGT